MSENTNTTKEQLIVHVTDEETASIPISEYRELVIRSEKLEIIARDIRRNIDNSESSYRIVNEQLVRMMTETMDYVKAETKVEADE